MSRLTSIDGVVVLVVAFFICWIPFHSQRLMFVVVTLYGEWSPRTQYTQHVLFMVVLCSAPSVPQPVFTITEKAPTRASVLNVKALVGAFNQEMAHDVIFGH